MYTSVEYFFTKIQDIAVFSFSPAAYGSTQLLKLLFHTKVLGQEIIASIFSKSPHLRYLWMLYGWLKTDPGSSPEQTRAVDQLNQIRCT